MTAQKRKTSNKLEPKKGDMVTYNIYDSETKKKIGSGPDVGVKHELFLHKQESYKKDGKFLNDIKVVKG